MKTSASCCINEPWCFHLQILKNHYLGPVRHSVTCSQKQYDLYGMLTNVRTLKLTYVSFGVLPNMPVFSCDNHPTDIYLYSSILTSFVSPSSSPIPIFFVLLGSLFFYLLSSAPFSLGHLALSVYELNLKYVCKSKSASKCSWKMKSREVYFGVKTFQNCVWKGSSKSLITY